MASQSALMKRSPRGYPSMILLLITLYFFLSVLDSNLSIGESPPKPTLAKNFACKNLLHPGTTILSNTFDLNQESAIID